MNYKNVYLYETWFIRIHYCSPGEVPDGKTSYWLRSEISPPPPALKGWGTHRLSLRCSRIMGTCTHLGESASIALRKYPHALLYFCPSWAFVQDLAFTRLERAPQNVIKDLLYNKAKHLVTILESSVNPIPMFSFLFRALTPTTAWWSFESLLMWYFSEPITLHQRINQAPETKASGPRVNLQGGDTIFPQTGSRKQAAARLQDFSECLSNQLH